MNWRIGTIIALITMSAGCKHKPASATSAPAPAASQEARPLALVDIKKVSQAMGWSIDIENSLAVTDDQLQTQLRQQLSDIYAQGTAQREKIAKAAHLNAEQTDRVRNMQSSDELYDIPMSADLRQQLVNAGVETTRQAAEARAQYHDALTQREEELAESYRKLVMPVAEQIAKKAGFQTVIAFSNDVIYLDPSTDVSQQVVDELKRARPKWEQSPAGK